MINKFNAKIAIDFNPLLSIFVQELAQWTFYNLANKKNLYDGYCWSYNTLEAFQVIFPWWNRRQLETIINNAVKEGLILKGNYNKHKYDRTCWYALSWKGLSYFPELYTDDFIKAMSSTISQKCDMETQGMDEHQICNHHFTKMRNGVHSFVTPIPSSLPASEISKDISTEVPESPLNPIAVKKPNHTNYSLKELQGDNPHNIPDRMLEEWLAIRKDKKKRVTQCAWDKINDALSRIEKEVRITPKDAFQTMVSECWQSLDVKYFKDDNKRNGKPNTDVVYI